MANVQWLKKTALRLPTYSPRLITLITPITPKKLTADRKKILFR